MTEAADRRWGMVIDINRCVGCQTCTVACKLANDTTPGVQWRGVIDVEVGRFPDVERLFLVTGCQHCAEPPCVPVCPSGATVQRADGLVTMNYDLCIGCAACALACPYQARTLVHGKEYAFGTETVAEAATSHDDRLGVAQKCTFCSDKIDDGLAKGLTPGVDLEATPACAASCITSAIQFGDFNDEESNVSRLVRDRASFAMHEDLGTKPMIRYLYETPAVPGREPENDDQSGDTMADPANPLAGKIQAYWDYRAAMNFIMGGLGAGLAMTGFIAFIFAGLPGFAVTGVYVAAGALIAVGLGFVWLKIGRKLRFLYVLLRPNTSWMSREVYAVGVFYAAAAADLLWPGVILHTVTALAALVFLYCQAKILHASVGIPAWRVSIMPLMMVASGLLEGAGLFAVLIVVNPAPGAVVRLTAGLVIGLALVNAVLWTAYRRKMAGQRHVPLAGRVIDRLTPWLHSIGHGLPVLLFAAILIRPDLPAWILGLGGLCALAGGVAWKALIITRAGQQQGFALAKFPRRGSGRLAAPAR